MSELRRVLREDAFYPPHDPRKASSEYKRTHTHLVKTLNTPCWICGITNKDVTLIPDVKERRRWQLETHHAELEWAAERAFEDDGVMLAALVRDLHDKVTKQSPEAVREFLDSEGNMLVLCATHHRGAYTGIHSITYPVWKLQRWQHAGGFQFVVQPDRP